MFNSESKNHIKIHFTEIDTFHTFSFHFEDVQLITAEFWMRTLKCDLYQTNILLTG